MDKEKQTALRSLQKKANIPPDARDRFLEEVEPRDEMQKRLIDLLRILLEGKTRTVLVCGTTDRGKTYICCTALNTFLVKVYNCEVEEGPMYITQSEMNMMFRSAMHDKSMTEMDLFNRFVSVPVLVIDELGRSKNSEYNMENIEAIIAKRFAWKKPTILISNGTSTEIKELFDTHILRRLNEGELIEMKEI